MLNDNSETIEYIKEALILNKLKHVNVIEFYGIVFGNDGIFIKYLLFEYMNMGDLLGYLKK